MDFSNELINYSDNYQSLLEKVYDQREQIKIRDKISERIFFKSIMRKKHRNNTKSLLSPLKNVHKKLTWSLKRSKPNLKKKPINLSNIKETSI